MDALVRAKCPVVLITGCGSGIGLALARRLAQDPRYRTVVTARKKSVEALKQEFTESDRLWIRELDVTSEEQMERVVGEVNTLWGGTDILINNAGICYRSVIEHMDEEAEYHQLRTNYLGPMALIRLVLPTMRERGSGRIINISSVSGLVPMPTMGSYSASKHALEAATEALWYELRPFGIQVTLVQPGFVQSDSFRNVYFASKARISRQLDGPYAEYYSYLAPFIEKWMRLSMSTPEKIAKVVARLMERRSLPLCVPVTFDASVFGWLRRLIPRRIFLSVMYRLLPGSWNWGGRFARSKEKVSYVFGKYPASGEALADPTAAVLREKLLLRSRPPLGETGSL